jgi:DNA (cytosine-5)-methyltransferase 1
MIANPLTARMHKGVNTTMDEGQTMIVEPVAYSIMPMNSGKDYKARETDIAQPVMTSPVGGNQGGDYVVQPMAFDTQQITSAANKTRVSPELPASTLAKASRMHVAFCATGEVFHTLRADGFDASEDGTGRGGGAVTLSGLQVRRLTPTECERLQGFPDGWTAIPYRGKPASDGPRYKALGNSMAVPVMAWIGRRIAAVEHLHLNQRAA